MLSEIASRGQLRASFLRWAGVTVPLVLFLGFLSGRMVPNGDANPWYAALAKPALTPPGWVFPVAWGVLYAMLGIALAIVLDARGARGRGVAVALFAVQLAGNLAWTPLFFGAHRITAAFVLILIVLALSIVTTLAFARIRQVAAWLMVPYMAWLGFAGALTWDIGQRNPGAEGLVTDGSTTQISL